MIEELGLDVDFFEKKDSNSDFHAIFGKNEYLFKNGVFFLQLNFLIKILQ